jgi:hypothetical protein
MWRRLRQATDQTGFYPLLLAEDGNLLDETTAESDSPAELLKVAATIDAAKWLSWRAEDCINPECPPDFSDHSPPDDSASRFETLEGSLERTTTFLLAFIPTRQPWQVFAYLGYGGWNSYPDAARHVAVMKYWYELYGAEPVVVTGDVIEMTVARPPPDRAACEALALEQFGYTAGDLVYQGYERFGRLATALQDSHYWFFWWD